MHKRIGALAFCLFAASSFATELVVNGNFESGDSPWTQSSSGSRTLIGNWSGTVVNSNGDFGPPTRTAWLGGYDNAIDIVSQVVTTVNGATATLQFDFYWTNEDIPTFDFFYVMLGDTTIYTQDLGDYDPVTLNGPVHHSFDVSSLMDGTAKALAFKVTTDGSANSSGFVDNVSLETAVVPEPATLAALGFGAAAIMRRRRK